MKKLLSRTFITLPLLITLITSVNSQTDIPDVLKKNSLKEQMNFLEERTRIYENYRAIREDMFQQVKANISDTISNVYRKINGLNITVALLNNTIDSLRVSLVTTKTGLEESIRTKNSISVLGMEVNKTIYNSVIWTVLAGLLALFVVGFLIFKHNLSVTHNTKNEYSELKNEYENYRKTSREAREKASMDHFKEIQRLKGG
jgi:ABC-type glycerol-3-phosphate transport system permease component